MKRWNYSLFNRLIIVSINLLFVSIVSTAQNASYNLNSVPVNGVSNSVFGVNAFISSGAFSDSNVAIGHSALSALTIGDYNVAIGARALGASVNGNSNVAVGADALSRSIAGTWNTAIGTSALANTSGSGGTGNTANGFAALGANTTGSYNTGLGILANVSSGALTNATAIGAFSIATASNAVQLGNSSVTQVFAGTGRNATIIAGGLQITGGFLGAGKVLTSDAFGVATWQTPGILGGSDWSLGGNAGTVDGTHFIGTTDNVSLDFRVNNEKAGRIDIGLGNAFFGLRSGRDITTGSANTGNGYQALLKTTSGFFNTGFGAGTLTQNTTGSNNTAIGFQSLTQNTNGSENTSTGENALWTNTTGSQNTAYGDHALQSNTTGNGNTALGWYAGPNALGLTNSTALGYGSIVNASNKIRLGDASVTIVEGPVAYTISDGRFKSNISESDVKGLAFINGLRPVVYNFDTRKFQEFLTQNMPEQLRKEYLGHNFSASSSIRQSGFIAQEVEKLAKEIGYDFNGVHIPESKEDNYSLAYSQFVVPLVKAVQELSKENAEIKKEVEQLKTLIKLNSEGSVKIDGSNEASRLYQNAPNPFNQSTVIRYSIPANAKKAVLTITSMSGAKMKEFDLKNNSGQNIEIRGGQLSAGTYTYSLIINDVLMDSKSMILTR